MSSVDKRVDAYLTLLYRIVGHPVIQLDRKKYEAIKRTWKPFTIESAR